jgi:hypothetical protein
MINISDQSWREYLTTHFVVNNCFYVQKSCRVRDNMKIYCRAGQATDDDMAHAHCMLDI